MSNNDGTIANLQSVVDYMHPLFRYRILVYLIIANIIASILHYVDNVIHFEHYPEPDWLNAQLVDLFWFFMTPFALLGLWLMKKQQYMPALFALIAYALMGLLVLGHYNYASFFNISFKIHLFIWLEAVLAGILLIYTPLYVHHHKTL